jgi:hypothetical protein
MHLNLWLLTQFSIIFIMIGQVTGDTESKNRCSFDQETLEMTIRTGDEYLAGTDDDINVLLRSPNGKICRAYRLDNDGNDRERNSVDKYTICCPRGFLSNHRELSLFALAHVLRSGTSGRGSLIGNDWFIESIELKTRDEVVLDYRFHAWTSPKKQWMFGVSKANNTNYIRF